MNYLAIYLETNTPIRSEKSLRKFIALFARLLFSYFTNNVLIQCYNAMTLGLDNFKITGFNAKRDENHTDHIHTILPIPESFHYP